MKILVVEDDRKVAGFIEQGLKEEGHVVDVAPDGDEATMLAHVYEYDVILLDVVLPKKNGFQIATELRREGRSTPILMLTSRDSTEDVIRGLDSGADDYLAKPFRFEELLARIRLRMRQSRTPTINELVHGDLVIDLSARRARVDGVEIDLTAREFALAEEFVRHPGQVLSREVLLSRIWGYDFDPGSNVVDVYIGHLRGKLGAERIETVRGMGYRMP